VARLGRGFPQQPRIIPRPENEDQQAAPSQITAVEQSAPIGVHHGQSTPPPQTGTPGGGGGAVSGPGAIPGAAVPGEFGPGSAPAAGSSSGGGPGAIPGAAIPGEFGPGSAPGAGSSTPLGPVPPPVTTSDLGISPAGSKQASGSAVIHAAADLFPIGGPGNPGDITAAATLTAKGTKRARGTAVIQVSGLVTPSGAKKATGKSTVPAGGLNAPAGGKEAAGTARIAAAGESLARAAKQGTGAASVTAGTAVTGTAAPVSVANTWTASYTAPVQPEGAPLPGAASVPVEVANTAGNWMFAVVAWRQAPGYPPVTFSVGDGANYWEPCGAPSGTSPASGTLRIAVWRAAAARAVDVVSAAPTGFCLSACVTVLEVDGLFPWIAEAVTLTEFAAAATSLPALAPASGGTPVLWLTAVARGLSSATTSVPSGGWQEGPAAATGNGLDHSGDLVLLTAFQQANGSVSATWSGAAASDMAGIITGVQVFAPAVPQPNPNWAPGTLEFAFGAGASTPPDELDWTPLDGTLIDGLNLTRVQDLSWTQGQQYTIGSLQAGQGSVTIDSRDLAATPPGLGAFTGIDSGTPWRYRITWAGGNGYPANPTPHYVLSGFCMDLPTKWNNTRRGIVTAGLTDSWAYCQPQIQSSLRQEILADNPTHCWPCGDAAGSTYASNIAPGSTASLALVTSKYGAAGATGDFGATSAQSAAQATVTQTGTGGLPGDNGTVWGQSGLPAAATSGGFALYCQDSAFPALNSPFGTTIECWTALADPAPLQQAGTLWAIKGSKGLIMRAWCDTLGALWLTTQDVTGAQVTTSLGATSYASAGMFQTVVTWLDSAGWIAYVNGVQAAAPASIPALAPSFAWIEAGGEADRFVSGNAFDGQTAFVTTFPQALSPARVASHFQAGDQAFNGEPDYSRLERLLGYAGYTSRRVIRRAPLPDLCASLSELGTSTAGDAFGGGQPQPAGTSTVQAGQEITSLVSSLTPALLSVSPGGDMVYTPKGLMFGNKPVWVLGEDAEAGEIPYEWDAALGWDPMRVVNVIQLTQVDRQDVVSPQAFVPLAPGFITPQASQGKYSQQTYQINAYLYNDLTTPLSSPNPSNVIDLANWLGVTLAQPRLRADKVTIDAASKPWAWPFVAGAAQGDVVVLNRRPITAQVTIMLLARVMRVERSISWKQGGAVARAGVTLDYSPELTPLVLDDPLAGQLTGSNVLTW